MSKGPTKESVHWHWAALKQAHSRDTLPNVAMPIWGTRPWPAFGPGAQIGSSFEYSYTRLASRLRRSAWWKCLETGEVAKPLKPCNLLNLETFSKPFPKIWTKKGLKSLGNGLFTLFLRRACLPKIKFFLNKSEKFHNMIPKILSKFEMFLKKLSVLAGQDFPLAFENCLVQLHLM